MYFEVFLSKFKIILYNIKSPFNNYTLSQMWLGFYTLALGVSNFPITFMLTWCAYAKPSTCIILVQTFKSCQNVELSYTIAYG
jgi:hypothetical protein